jgi:hypothetical protein
MDVREDERDSGIRLAELVAAFSLATDLGLGLPMEHVLRSWLIASRLGDQMGLDAAGRRSLYYVVTLAWVGCVADTPEVAAWFGDDIAYRRDSFGVDRAGLPMMVYSLRHAGAGSPPLHRLRLGASLVLTGAGQSRGGSCLIASRQRSRPGEKRGRRAGSDCIGTRRPRVNLRSRRERGTGPGRPRNRDRG